MDIPIYRVSLIKDGALSYATDTVVLTPQQVSALIREFLQNSDREHFIVVFLDSRSAVIGLHTVSIGTLTESLVHPREVFKAAIVANAASIVVAHNHPSGTAHTSEADISVTNKLKEAGRIIGIPVEDHVVIGDEKYFSFREEGLL
jgi:DNA repair protein RadC